MGQIRVRRRTEMSVSRSVPVTRQRLVSTEDVSETGSKSIGALVR